MKITRRQVRKLILENLSARDKFMQAMEQDRDSAAQHYDDLLAREQGYDSHLDKSFDAMVTNIGRESELEDRLNQMSREEVGLPDSFIPSEHVKFNNYKGKAEKALDAGDQESFVSSYEMMLRYGTNFDSSNPDAWKSEPGVDRLIKAMDDLTPQGGFFDVSSSPILRSLGIMENKKMNIARKQIRKLILKEMDMMTMGQVAGGVIMSIASLFLVLGPIALHGLMDGYMRGLFSEHELRKMHELSQQDPEMGKQYMESILAEKGYEPGMLPTHHTAGRDTQPARDYTSQHGDILPPSDFDIDDL